MLKKGGTRFQTKWQKRFFVLTDSALTYYAEEQAEGADGSGSGGGTARGSVQFEGQCVVTPDPSVHKSGFGFKLQVGGGLSTGRTLELVCEDQAELDDWVFKIREKIKLQGENLTGYLSKRANSVPWNWKRRFFVLSHTNLSYTKRKKKGGSSADAEGEGDGRGSGHVRGVLMLTHDARVNESPTIPNSVGAWVII